MRGEGIAVTYAELKQKDVVNVRDGRRLGKPIDLVLNDMAVVEALVVPVMNGGFLNLLKQEKEGCLVPWGQIIRIGDDVILVDLCESDYPDGVCEGNSN